MVTETGTMAFLASGGASDSVHRQCGGHSYLATETGTMAFLASGGASDSVHRQCGGHSCLATETGTLAFLASGGASDSVHRQRLGYEGSEDFLAVFPHFFALLRVVPELSASCSLGALDDEEFFIIEGSGVALTPGVGPPGVGPPGHGSVHRRWLI